MLKFLVELAEGFFLASNSQKNKHESLVAPLKLNILNPEMKLWSR